MSFLLQFYLIVFIQNNMMRLLFLFLFLFLVPACSPQTKFLSNAPYDATVQIEEYAQLAHYAHQKALKAAKIMQTNIQNFLDYPSQRTLHQAQYAWMDARKIYMKTEAFYADSSDPVFQRLNQDHIEEHLIDDTDLYPPRGFIHQHPAALTKQEIILQQEVSSYILTGWHAIEFMLWGKDSSLEHAGQRSATDFALREDTIRRREYLRLVTEQLIDDLTYLVEAWDPKKENNYAAYFQTLSENDALTQILQALIDLLETKMMIKRLAIPLDSNDPDREHSRFSDQTHHDLIHNIEGVRAVYFAYVGNSYNSTGISRLIGKRDRNLHYRITKLLQKTEKRIRQIDAPFDQMLSEPAGSKKRHKAELSILALQRLIDAFEAAKLVIKKEEKTENVVHGDRA